ncbi:MAG TPA: hypothetical protein DIS78_10130 [Lachnospiraceae bacterium]|nr:hypothetical protein [Lachnospiraceae bacterium]
MKEVLTVVITLAMILTSFPQDVIAAGLEGDDLILSEEVISEAEEAVSADTTTLSGSEVELVELKFAPSEDVTEIKYREYDPQGDPVGSEVTLTGSLLSSNCLIKKGDSVSITSIICGTPETDGAYFKRITVGDREIGTYGIVDSDEYYEYDGDDEYEYEYEDYSVDLGTIDSDSTVSVATARFPLSDIVFNTESENGVTISVSIYERDIIDIDGVEYVNASMLVDQYDYILSVIWLANVNNPDPLWHYIIKPLFSYEIEGFMSEEKEVSWYDDSYYGFLSGKAVIEAAFSGRKLTAYIGLEKTGYKKQSVKILRNTRSVDDKPEDVSVRMSGEPVHWTDNDGYGEYGYWISYGRSADVTVKPTDGYTLRKVCYLSDKTYNELSGNDAEKYAAITADKAPGGVTVVEAENGTASFTISDIMDCYRVFAVETENYVLKVNSGGKNADTGKPIDVSYNAGSRPEISVVYGSIPQDLSLGRVSANVVSDDGSSVDVTAAVFGEITSESTSLTFDPSDVSVRGRRVNVSISKDEAGSDPGYDFSLTFVVSNPITADTVSLTGDVTNVLGTETRVSLQTGKDYKPGSVGVRVEGADVLDARMSEDGKEVTIRSSLTRKNADEIKALLANHGLKLVLYDVNDQDSVISQNKLTVTAEQVTDTDLSEGVIAIAGADSISLDLSKIKLSAPDAEGLYYEVKAVTTMDTSELKREVRAMVPATAKKYEIVLANNDDSFEPDPITYTVTARLMQVTTGTAGVEAVTDDTVASTASGRQFAKSVSTVQDGTFPTGISIKANKDKNVTGRLFDTVDEDLPIGTVIYDRIGKESPKVQRIRRVEIDGVEDPDVVYENNGTVYINPYNAGEGKHSIVAYAVEPGGMDVATGAFSVNVKEGISRENDYWISAPDNIYKPVNKAVKLKPEIRHSYRIANKIRGKVEWSLVTGKEKPWEQLDFKGIRINKKGTVTIDKDVTIPDEGISFTILARPKDYPGNTNYLAKDVEVHAVSEPPAFIRFKSGFKLTDGASYTSNEINGLLGAYDSYGNPINDIEFSVSGLKSKINIYGIENYYADKANIKKVTVTAAKTDGSGLKKTVTFKIKSADMIADLTDGNGKSLISSLSAGSIAEVTNSLGAGKPMTLNVGKSGLTDHKIKVTGGKKKAYMIPILMRFSDMVLVDQHYTITPTAPVTVISLTEKATGKVTRITVKNTMITSNKAKTNVTGYDKYDNKGNILNALYFANDEEYAASGSGNKVTYTVKSGKKPLTGKVHVSVSDYALKDVFDANAQKNTAITEDADGEYTITTDKDGRFDIDYWNVTCEDAPDEASFFIPTGTYSFEVTPVDDAGVPVAGPATFKFKAKAAPKASVVLKAGTFRNFTTLANILFKKQKNIVADSVIFTGTLGNNTKGKISSFRTTFAVENGKLICKRAVRPDEEKSITGWVQYTWTGLDGSTGSACTKVTVKAPGNGKIKPE